MSKKIIALLLAVMLTLSFFPLNSQAKTEATEEDKQRLEELEKSIEANEKLLKETKNNANAIKALMEDLDEKIAIIEAQVDSTKEEKLEIEKQLRQANADLAQAVKECQQYEDILSERIDVMYKYGNTGYLELLLSAESLSDFLDKISAIKTIVSFDNDVITDLQIAQTTVQQKKDEIQTKNDELETILEELDAKQTELETTLAEREATFEELNGNIASLQILIEQEEKDAAELRKLIGEDVSGVYDTDFGNLKWPTPGYTTITDYYGWRIHPISGYRAFHYGIDIGAPRGARIVAPGNGKVTMSKYYGGYGNCIILNLGKNSKGRTVTMIFGHASKLIAKKGDIVSRGDTLALVGSTGNSTGPHLHFEYLENGTNYDPLKHVKKGNR